MKWSKLKQTLEGNFAQSINKRVNLHITRYTSGSYFMVRGWITIDKIEIANFSTPDNYAKFGWDTPEINARIVKDERHPDQAVEKGEFSRWDFLEACWEYLNLSIEEAVLSNNPIIQSFAILDKRLGKRRLKIIDITTLNPLVSKMLKFRLDCEKMNLQ